MDTRDEGQPIRLQKYLAACGVASRRGAEGMIAAGRVEVNGEVVTLQGVKVNPGDIVRLDGRAVVPEAELAYFAFYKPPFVVTTMHDPRGRRTVAEFFADNPLRLFPVGRLDYESEGLLLVTNDGAWAQRVSHPRHGQEKEYFCIVRGALSPAEADALRRGVALEDGPTWPAQVESIRPDGGNTRLRITIHEGRNRQVRRMLAVVGHPVVFLKRLRIGPVGLGELKAGGYRALTQAEVRGLRGE